MGRMQDRAEQLRKKYNLPTRQSGDKTAVSAGSASEQKRQELRQKYGIGQTETAPADARKQKSVSDWVSRYNKVMKGIADYDAGRNGGYTTDASGGYGKELDDLIAEFEEIRPYAKQYGLVNPTKQINFLRNARSSVDGINRYMAQFESQEAYDQHQAYQKEQEDLRSLNLEDAGKEIAHLERVRDEWDILSRTMTDDRGKARLAQLRQQYGELENLDRLITQRTTFRNRAKYLQKQSELAGVGDETSASYDPEFGRFSAAMPDEKDGLYSYINDTDGYRASYQKLYGMAMTQTGLTGQETPYEQQGLDLMTESEVATFNYYYAKHGKEKAKEYLSSIQETLSQRKASGIYEGLQGNTALEIIFGMQAGVDQFQSGLRALVSEEDYIPASATQMVSGAVREDLADVGGKLPRFLGGASAGQVLYDAVTTTANMAPSILTSMAVGALNPVAGQVAGTALMGASAAGHAYQEAVNLGYDKDQARGYSILIGASEAALQYVLGGIGKLGGAATGNLLTNALNGIDNGLLRVAVKLGGNMLSEGLEEGLQEILTPLFQNMMLGADADIDWSEAAYSAILGGLTALVMEGGETVAGEAGLYRLGKDLQAAEVSPMRLAELGSTFAADTVAYRLAGRVDENTDAYTMGRLFNEIGATLTEQNVSEITEALVQKNMPEHIARKNAEVLAQVVEGASFTEDQIRKIQNNDILAEVVRSTLIEQNTTWNQRTAGYRELEKLAREKVSQKTQEQASSATVPAAEEVRSEGYAKVSRISVKDGKISVTTEDGTEAETSKANISPEDTAIIETIADIEGITGEDVNFLYQVISRTQSTAPGADAYTMSHGAKEVYRYGYFGFNQEHIAKHGVFAGYLSESQRKAIYDTARKTGTSRKAPDRKTQASTGIYFETKDGKIPFSRTAMKLDDRRSAGVQLAVALKKLGIGGDIYFYESYRNAKGAMVYQSREGEKKAPNGWYDPSDGSIHIDLNAGSGGEGMILFTLAHELVHFIEQWSPEKYRVLADFLVENYEKGQSMDKLVTWKRAKLAQARGVSAEDISYQEAYSEVIADSMEAMLADGQVLEKLIDLKARDNSLFEKIRQFFRDLSKKIAQVYKDLVPDSEEGKAVLRMRDSVDRIQDLFAEALVEAGENFRTAADAVVAENATPTSTEEISTDGAYVTAGDGMQFSIRSMNHDIAEGRMFEDLKQYCDWSQEQVDTLRKNLEALVDYMTPFRDILDLNESYGREGRRFSPYNPNSDPLYTISLDFSTLCSKRLLTQYVIENLQLRENRPMSAEEQMAIRDMLIEYRKVEKGLQVACAMCYVEAARLKSPKQMNKWISDPAEGLKSYFAAKNKEYAAFIKKQQEDFKESRGYARNTPKKDMLAKDVTALNKIGPRLKANYTPSPEELQIMERAKALPASTYLTAGNLADLSATEPEIYAAYTTFVRNATRSKSLETDEPYYYGDSRRDNGNGIVVTDSFVESVNRENGMRFSSWSDWRIHHMLDYITAVIDCSVRGAAMHGYTKFGEEIRVLGKTGMMFNMSGVAGTHTGLNTDGSLSFSPTESMDAEEAIQLREDFPETAGLQCIGVGDDHIIALMDSDIIDYIIPYHTSGLNKTLRAMADIHKWKDYTGTQHASADKGATKKGSPEKWHEEPVFSEFFVGYDTGMTGIEAMRKSAERYKQMCRERGLIPKFNQFSSHPNYWKLLIDRKMINQKTGALIRQRPVTPTFDFDAIKGVVDRFVQNYDAGMESRALAHIVRNWDSIPGRIRELKKNGAQKKAVSKKGKDPLKAMSVVANEMLAAQAAGKVQQSSRDYSYSAIISKKPMTLTLVPEITLGSRADVIRQAKENAIPFGRIDSATNGVMVHVKDTGTDVLLGTKGLKHGLDRRFSENGPVTLVAGEILSHAIQINEANPRENAEASYVLLGAAKSNSGELFVVRFVVNRYSNELSSVDVLYAMNAKKRNRLRSMRPGFQGPVTDSTISISDLLDYVNEFFPEVLPEDILRQYGHETRPADKLGESMMYQERADDSLSHRAILANAFEGVAQTDLERKRLEEYRAKIRSLNRADENLQKLNGEIRVLSGKVQDKTITSEERKRLRTLKSSATKTANRITLYDSQLLRMEASAPLQRILERETAKREQRAEKEKAEILAKHEASQKRQVENRRKTAEKAKIRKAIRELDKLLNRGTKKRNVKEDMKGFVGDAIASAEILFMDSWTPYDMLRQGIGTDLNDQEEKLVAEARDILRQIEALPSGSYEAWMEREEAERKLSGKLSRRIAKLDDVFVRERKRIYGQSVETVLTNLAESYARLQDSQYAHVQGAYQEAVYQYLLMVKEHIGGTTVRDMTLEQLQELHKAYTMVLTTVRNANRMFASNLGETREKLAGQVISEVTAAGGVHGLWTKTGEAVNNFSWNNEKPVYAFLRIGSDTLTKLFGNIRKGQDVWAVDMQEADAFRREQYRRHKRKEWDLDKRYKFTSAHGQTFELGLEQIMSLYAYSRREQALDHLMKGGFVFDGATTVVETKHGIKRTFLNRNATAYTLDMATFEEIIGILTAEQKAFVEEMQEYLSATMGDKGNQVAMEMYGVKLFTEKHYFPLRSAGQYMERAKEASLKQEQGQISLANSGFAKSVKPKASNPVVLSGFMDVWANHVSDMSMYHAFVLPMEDFRRVYNFSSYSDEKTASVSVNGVIQNAWGKAATDYIDQLYRDLNGGALADSRAGIMKRFMNLYKKGAVFASMSVTIQQPSAILRAMGLVDARYFVGRRIDPKRHKAIWAEVKKYAPVALIKEMGRFDTNMGRTAVEYLTAEEYEGAEKIKGFIKDEDYRDEVLSIAPALADEYSWSIIWEAVKRETAARNPKMDARSEAFLKLAGARFSEVIDKTQVYDSVLARSANMRSKDAGMIMATAFMAEPTTSINMIEDAIRNWKHNKVTSRRIIRSVIASQVLNALLVSLVYAARDDDEEKSYWEKYAQNVVSKTLDSLNPMTYYPILRDVASIMQGYDVERSDMSVVSDLWKAFEKLWSKDISAAKKAESFAENVCQIFGLPLKNILRDIRSIWNVADWAMNGEDTTLAGMGYAIREGITGKGASNPEQLYTARKGGDASHAARVEARYFDPEISDPVKAEEKQKKSADSAVRQVIRDKFLSGELSEADAFGDLLMYAGVDTQEAFWLMDEWKWKLTSDEEYRKYDSFVEAVRKGENLEDVIRKYTENGVKPETLSQQITTQLKDEYLYATESQREKLRSGITEALLTLGYEEDTVEERLREWDFEADFGAEYVDLIKGYLDGEVSRQDMKAMLMDRGYIEIDAEDKLDDWDFERESGFAWSDRRALFQKGEISAEQLRDALVGYGQYSEEDADAQIAVYELEMQGYEAATINRVQKYNTYCAPAGVSLDDYYHIIEFSNNTENDVDEEGKTINYSAVQKVMAEINRLPISAEQKEAIARSIWKEKTVKKYRLW